MPQAADPPKNLERPAKGMHRSFSGPLTRVREEGDDENIHRYTFKASSDAEVEMWGRYFEILDHEASSVRMEWLKSGNAPLLDIHNKYTRQVGVIESAELKDDHIEVTVRIAPSQTELIADLEAGVIRNVSIGYRVHDERIESRQIDENGNVTKVVWRVVDWEPNEVSFVPIPADRTVGIGRSAEEDEERKSRVKFLKERLQETTEPPTPDQSDQTRTMPAEPAEKTEKKPTVTVDESRSQRESAVTAERERIAAIHRIADKAREDKLGNHTETAQKFIEEGRSVQEFQTHVLENIERTGSVSQKDLNIDEKEAQRYDLNKVITGLARGDMGGCERELDISDAIKDRAGRTNDRVAIPMDVLMRNYLPRDERLRATSSVTGGAGNASVANIVENELLDELFIESLREESPVLGLGVQILTGLTGDVTIPRELTNPSFYWVGEDTEPTEGAHTMDQIALSFKTLAARVPFTRQALKQSTPNIEGILTRSLRRGHAIALEQALINGAGTATEPEGILGTSGIGSVATTAGVMDYGDLLELEEDLDTANAETAGAVLLTNARGKRRLLETKKDAGSGIMLATREGGQIMTDIGRVVTTNNVPNNLGGGTDRSAIIYGNFRSLLVAMWGNLEIARDTSTKAATGGVVLRVFSDVDAIVGRAAEFSAIQDLL